MLKNVISPTQTRLGPNEMFLGSMIVFIFKESVKISKLRILSGGVEHPNDKLPTGSSVCYSNSQMLDPAMFRDESSFKKFGAVNENGNFNISFDESKAPHVSTIRILINQKSKYWLWIYDFYIEKY